MLDEQYTLVEVVDGNTTNFIPLRNSKQTMGFHLEQGNLMPLWGVAFILPLAVLMGWALTMWVHDFQ